MSVFKEYMEAVSFKKPKEIKTGKTLSSKIGSKSLKTELEKILNDKDNMMEIIEANRSK